MKILSPAAPLALLVATALATAVHAAPRPADRIHQSGSSRPLTVDQVTADHWDKVEYKKSGRTLSLDGRKVETIEYGDAPESFELALDKLAEGDFENAASLMKGAMAESGVRPWIKVHGAFQLGEIYRRWGARDRQRYADAIEAYSNCLAQDEKTRLRPRALFGRALAHLGAGDLDKGLADLDLLAKEAYENKYGVTWELNALRERANALAEAGRTSEARSEFQKLATNARSFAGNDNLSAEERAFAAEVAGLARLEQGRVLIEEGKARDAERFFDQIASDENEVEAVRAAALVGKGAALMGQNELKQAQFAFATVRIKHYLAEEAVAEATYRLGLCAEALGAREPRGSQLAQDYFLEVIRRHPDSRWAKKAQEKLH